MQTLTARHKQRLHQGNERAIEVPDITLLGMSMVGLVASTDGILAVWLKGLARTAGGRPERPPF
ncbi:hypothetical protein [Verrucomicrobium spinosum]|uniref:hypothetical protein n=1 Tax=Verrucomicrobium spinosum TaxID=2736 RepID=UPI000305DAE6|nr:hypothetical protein [Verrucomicrobium spinosum]